MKTTTETCVSTAIRVIVAVVALSAIAVVFTLAGIGFYFATHRVLD